MSARKPSPVDELMRLAAWARREGFCLGPIVEIGELKLQFADLRQPRVEGNSRGAEAPDGGIYATYGLEDGDVTPGTAG